MKEVTDGKTTISPSTSPLPLKMVMLYSNEVVHIISVLTLRLKEKNVL